MEAAGAEQLGRILFEFGKFEMDVALCVVWACSGQRMDVLTGQVNNSSFGDKLDLLRQLVDQYTAPDSSAWRAYGDWLARADDMRRLRNRFAHGRWGVDPKSHEIVNVAGVPTSLHQNEVRFTIEGLSAVIGNIKELRASLALLREEWPL